MLLVIQCAASKFYTHHCNGHRTDHVAFCAPSRNSFLPVLSQQISFTPPPIMKSFTAIEALILMSLMLHMDLLFAQTGNYFAGHQAGTGNTGSYNAFVGYQSGPTSNSGLYNTFLGYRSGYINKSGGYNVFIGSLTGSGNTTGATNTFVGFHAGRFNSTGSGNSFFGALSGYNTTVGGNSFFGSSSGYSNSTGANNSFFGTASGQMNQTGYSNSFFGYQSGLSNTTGNSNTFVGNTAGLKNIAANGGTFIGHEAGLQNTYGTFNTFVGRNAGSSNTVGNYNSFIGAYAGTRNVNGHNNVFVGQDAGYNNSGSSGTFIGSGAGYSNANAANNVFVGYFAGRSNTTGHNNVFIGARSGNSTVNGAQNIYIGTEAGFSATSGTENLMMGYFAGRLTTTGARNTFVGSGVAPLNTTGVDNTFIGRLSGAKNTTGFGNTALGQFAGPSSGALSNATAIGFKAYVSTSNSLVLGSVAGVNGAANTIKVGIGTNSPGYLLHVNGVAAKPGGGSWTVASDKELKQEITPYEEGLSQIIQIQPVWFRYNGKAGLPVNKRFVGVIAQDMQIIAPYTVGEFMDQDSTGKQKKYLDYDGSAIVYMLVNAVKELKAQNDLLRQEMTVLRQALGKHVPTETDARLYQNFPNPFGNATVIQFYIPDQVSSAELKIYAVNGQEVWSQRILQRGEGSVEIAKQTLAEGSYVYNLVIDGAVVDNKKMLLKR